MDENRVEGAGRRVIGSVKEAIGKVTGDTKLEAEGKVDKVAGAAENAAVGAKDAMPETAKKK